MREELAGVEGGKLQLGYNIKEKNKGFKKCFVWMFLFLQSLVGWFGLVLETGFHSRLGWSKT